MKRFFITGVSGVGKSTVSEILNQRGIFSIDIDAIPGLCTWRDRDTEEEVKWNAGRDNGWFKKHEYICDRDRLIDLIGNKDTVVVVGLPSNRSQLLDLFDKLFLLHAKEETFLKRIEERENNDFGKHVLERENILSWYKDFEKGTLEKGAIPINADRPISEVVDEIISML